MRFCRSCGSDLGPTPGRFCPSCGAQVAAASPDAATQVVPAAAPPEDATQVLRTPPPPPPSGHAAPPSRGRGPLVAALVALALLLGAGVYLLTRDDSGRPDPGRQAAVLPTESAMPSEAPSESPSPAASPSASPSPSPTVSPRPIAVGSGRPSCNGPCEVQHRVTRSFLPAYGGQQTLLLASSDQADADGNMLHAFLVDSEGRVLWQEHGFGWSYQRVDEKFAVRFDATGHVFWRVYVADHSYIYVLYTYGDKPRLVGAPGEAPESGFGDAEVFEHPGDRSFRIRESLSDCPPDAEVPEQECPTVTRVYRWNGSKYVRA